jgi:glycosyltransferase involved in cell wall biosynthesis
MNQTRRADEIIAIDDASTDSTAAILSAPEWMGRIGYSYNDTPTGYADAVNRVMAKSTGDFVTVLDHDDMLHPEYLYIVERLIKKFPSVKHFFSGCLYIDESGRTMNHTPLPHTLEPALYTGKEYARKYLQGVATNNHIHRCPGVTTHRQLFLEKCSYRKEAGIIPDDDFFYRIGLHTDVVGISQPLASARLHGRSLTSIDTLSRQLARDYVFEIQFYMTQRGVFDAADIRQFHRLAARFINYSLLQALTRDDDAQFHEALALRKQCEELIGETLRDYLPSWSKLMWRFASGNRKVLARTCAIAVQKLAMIRNVVKD